MQDYASITSFPETRTDFAQIAKWIAPESKVLDLGCGDGSLLASLKKSHHVRGYGVEKNDQSWLSAMNLGVNVIQMDLEDGLSGFEENSFDVVILSQTLQAVLQTEKIIREMLRVGREVIVTFPNFGYWRHRAQLMAGRMPVSKNLPFEWYNSPNVHFCTINDFDDFCNQGNIHIKERLVLTGKNEITFLPNLRGSLAMYRLCNG
jgi:methionine biosynthesis protein MetW